MDEKKLEMEKAEELLKEESKSKDANAASQHTRPFTKEEVKEIKAKEKYKPYMILKNIIGWFGALVALSILLVPFFIIGIISFCSDPGTIFFCPTRCGKNGKPFKIIKFRTMKKGVIHEHVSAQALTDEDYKKTSNAWQRFLRRTSIDELPQIFNILTGSMNWIGPRPLVYNESVVIQLRIENGSIHCKPGLSGLAQVSGRRGLDYVTKAEYDGEYYKKLGLWEDIKLFFKTIFYVFERKDAE